MYLRVTNRIQFPKLQYRPKIRSKSAGTPLAVPVQGLCYHHRVRPKLPKKPSITAQEWERVREESEPTKELLEDPRFSFLPNLERPQVARVQPYHQKLGVVNTRLGCPFVGGFSGVAER